ncbi:hypothetical protein HQ520_02155, partial [bacterium]|nr:hypothetical protein [bacterium]
RTVVMVTHDVDHLPACCDRVLLLKTGQVRAMGAPSGVFEGQVLSDLYGCAMEVAPRGGRYHAFSLGGEERS